jgi:hypothetical protein
MEKPFTITSFAWRQEIEDKMRQAGCAAEDSETINASLVALAQFLERHNLTTRKLLEGGELIFGREFALRSPDLTEKGMAVLRAGYQAWASKGYPAADLRPLEKAYQKLALQPLGFPK